MSRMDVTSRRAPKDRLARIAVGALCTLWCAAPGQARAQEQQEEPGQRQSGEAIPRGALSPPRPDVGVPDVSQRAGGERPTIQYRFASKQKLLMVQPILMTHVRDDFYDSWGFGADVSYFLTERFGLELRALKLQTSLDNAAFDIKERFGLVPDARPQSGWLQLGMRYAPGYGKFLMWKRFLVHFDPQLVLHLGVATADKRYLPTSTLAMSFLTHWRWGIKAKLDLGLSMQFEKRERGWVFTTGFAPVLGIGWGRNF